MEIQIKQKQNQVANTETWNGSSWTEVNDLNTGRGVKGCGASASDGIIFGGTPSATTITETWDGTSWTEVSDLNTARGDVAGAGVQAAALAMGGYAPPSAPSKGVAVEDQVANTETWNGSSWTATPNINTARGYVGHAGTSTASIIFAGRAPGPSTSNAGESQVANTETWNGSQNLGMVALGQK